MNTILLLEDEESLRRGIQFKLEREGYRCIACGSLKEGKALLGENDVQLVLCDITLTDGNGLSFLTYIRQQLKSDLQFIFLTAMDLETDIVMGYETGADDYITKPFSLAVLMSKINAIFKRMEKGADNGPVTMKSGHLLFCPSESRLLAEGRPVSLTKNENKLLQLFFSHPKQILSKNQILEKLFDLDGAFADENTVAVNINRLREKIQDHGEARMIKNIRGMGYVWNLSVEKA